MLADILAAAFLVDELLVDILVNLVLLVQMLSLILDGNPTDDAVKQLKWKYRYHVILNQWRAMGLN